MIGNRDGENTSDIQELSVDDDDMYVRVDDSGRGERCTQRE